MSRACQEEGLYPQCEELGLSDSPHRHGRARGKALAEDSHVTGDTRQIQKGKTCTRHKKTYWPFS